MTAKPKQIYILSLLIVGCLSLVSVASTTYATSAEADSSPTPTPSASPSPTPDPETIPTPESTTKDIPASESNPAWLLEQERQFYAKPTVIAAVVPTPSPKIYYRYIQITPTPSPTPLIAQNSTQVKGTSSAIAYKQTNQPEPGQHSLSFLALISIIVSLSAIILSRILKPKTIR